MPLIEELPATTAPRASHGWAYVPDLAPIAAQQPGTRDRDRKRVTTQSRHTVSSTAKREKAIQARLDALNKENYKDGVTVPIPPRGEKRDRKMTSNVKRILGYQRTFAHYWADVEGTLGIGALHYAQPNVGSAVGTNMSMGPPPTPAGPTAGLSRQGSITTSTSKDGGRTRRGGAQSTVRGSPDPATPTASQSRGTKRARQSSRSQSITSTIDATPAPSTPKQKLEDNQTTTATDDTTMHDAPSTSSHPPSQPTSPLEPPYPPNLDTDPLLTSNTPFSTPVPPMPTAHVMHLLISEPPLTFEAARAKPLDEEHRLPPRKFCGICGYWGRVRCAKCEDFTCGLMECWKGHEGVCVARMY